MKSEVTTASVAASDGPAFTIPEFCEHYGISHATYHKLQRQGQGPAELRLGGVVRITFAARHAWEASAVERANKNGAKTDRRVEMARRAGRLAAKSANHVSKVGRRNSKRRA
jgi:hypothetical protein